MNGDDNTDFERAVQVRDVFLKDGNFIKVQS